MQTDSPSGAAVEVTVPHLTPNYIAKKDEQDSSDTRSAKMTLPLGMGLNPSSANGLKVCTDAQFGKGTKNPVACPPESKIGTVTIESAPLPEGNLEGNVYVGQQLSRDPTSGNEYRIFVDAESARYGISVRQIGNVSANPITGQLTTTFSETPQVPFESFKITLDGGPRAALSSPPTCGPNAATTLMTPVVRQPAGDPRRQLHPDQRSRRRQVCENPRGTSLWAELQRQRRQTPMAAPTPRSTSTSSAPTATRS